MKFRQLAALAFVLFTLSLTGRATDVVFLLSDSRLGIGQATNRTVWVQRMSYPDSVSGTTVILGDKLIFTTDSNGACTFSNAAAGLYSCSVQAPPTKTQFSILITATNLGTIYAADCLVAASTATFPAGSVAWSASVTDTRYARSATSLSNFITGATLTNALLGYQPASANLSNYSGLSTNVFVNGTTLGGVTNSLRSYTDSAGLAGTNFTKGVGTSLTNLVTANGTTTTNFILAQGTTITNVFYPRNNPSNYITAVVTNGLATQTYAQGLTNTLYALLGTAAFSNSAVFYPRTGNPSNWVDATITNALSARLGTAAFSNSAVFYAANNPNSYVTASVTNGLATRTYAESLTNSLGLGNAAFSNSVVFYPRNNPSNFVDATVTNNLNARLGTAAFSNSTSFYAANNPSSFVTASVTNGLAKLSEVTAATNTLGVRFTSATNSLQTQVNARLLDTDGIATNSLRVKGHFIADTNVYVNGTNFVNKLFVTNNSTFGGQLIVNGAGVVAQFFSGTGLTNVLIGNDGVIENSTIDATHLAYLGDVTGNIGAALLTKQLGSANLTNWSAHPTNDYLGTNQFYLLRAKDVTSNNISAGQGLFWDGSKFTNGAPPTPSAASTFNSSQFVSLGGVTNIKNGAIVTNFSVHEGLTVEGGLTNSDFLGGYALYSISESLTVGEALTTLDELNFLSGVTGGIQTNIDARAVNVDGIVTNSFTVKGNESVVSNSWVNSLVVTNKLTNSTLTASRPVYTDANKALSSSGTSAGIAASIPDETGTGNLVFNTSAKMTNLFATNFYSTNANFYLTNTVEGSWAWSSGTISTLVDGDNTVSPGEVFNVKLSQLVTDTWGLVGIGGGRANKRHRLFNDTGFAVTLKHQSGTASATDRLIIRGYDADLTLADGAVAEADYDATSSRWRVTPLTPPSVRVYKALLNQSGTNAPTATVLINTLGGTVVWTRNATGDYFGTLASAFPAGKVAALSTVGSPTDFPNELMIVFRSTDNRIEVQTSDTGALADDVLDGDCLVSVEVYP